MKKTNAMKSKATTQDGSAFAVPVGQGQHGAATLRYEYRLCLPDTGIDAHTIERMQTRFSEIMAEKKPEFRRAIADHAMTENEAADELVHVVLTQLASEFRLRYYRILKGDGCPPR